MPFTECHYVECRNYLNVMLSVIMLNVIMLSVVRLNVVMLSVVAPERKFYRIDLFAPSTCLIGTFPFES